MQLLKYYFIFWNFQIEGTNEVQEGISVEESETVQIKTVICLETTPPSSASNPPEADTQAESVNIVEPPVDFPPPSEPAVPVEEPTLPESASIVSSEVSVEMPTVEAVVCGVDDMKDGE